MKDQLKNREYWGDTWELFKAGNRVAFREIYREFIDVLYAYGSKITSNKSLVQDSIQELFINLYKYRENLDNPDYLEFYLFRSLRRIIISELKKEKKLTRIDDSSTREITFDFDLEKEIIEKESSSNRSKSIGNLIAGLDSKKRELLYLKFYSGLNYGEIGKLLGIKPDTAKKQVYRLLDELRKKFGQKLMELFFFFFEA